MSDESGGLFGGESSVSVALRFFDQPEIDRLLYTVVALTGEGAELSGAPDSVYVCIVGGRRP